MIFSSIPFLFYFLPCVLIAYYLVPKPMKNMVLLLASLVFYGWGEPVYVFLMVASIFVGYLCGIMIEKSRGTKWATMWLWISIVVGFGFLGYFKYADFFIENFNAITGLGIPLLRVVLPIGISFYTFQLVSYVIDVYWGQVPAQKNPLILGTYITMFPQLIAGPIVRYSDVEKQLTERSITFEKIAYGIRRFMLGMGKKILIANVLGEFASAFKATDEKSVLFFWAYAVAISLQIYFDFSGYSDMAIGLGSMLGFTFMENFNYPYISKSITEFWRRWHISLGTWFRDYVYIPLGGSRCSIARNIFHIFVVWMFTGLWHGAQWNFVLWGIYFGVFLVIEKIFLLKWLTKVPVLGHVYALFLVMIGFVIFDASSVADIGSFLTAMFGGAGLPLVSDVTFYYLKSYAVVFVLALIGATPFAKYGMEKLMQQPTAKIILEVLEPVVMIVLLLISTGYLVDGSFNPFLYFRF